MSDRLMRMVALVSIALALPLLAQEENGPTGNDAGVRLKDLARITGIRSNQLIGYGLVVGLPGTGDTRSPLASDSIRNLLGGLGLNPGDERLNAQNVAAVIVTGEVPPLARPGDRVNVTVSSIGDARSLSGGVLIQTPLVAGNGTIYAVAQGALTTGGAEERRPGQSGPTVGTVLAGATMERTAPGGVLDQDSEPGESRVRVSLIHFDFSTLNRLRDAVAAAFPEAPLALDGGSLIVTIPEEADPIAFIARMEQLRIEPEQRARVIINERSGTIVMGGDLKIQPVAVSRSGMGVEIRGDRADALMGIFTGTTDAEERPPTTREFEGASVGDIVQGMNEMGAEVRDIIAILEALRDSGALHAEIIVM